MSKVIGVLDLRMAVLPEEVEDFARKLAGSNDPAHTLSWSDDMINSAAQVSAVGFARAIANGRISEGLSETELVEMIRDKLTARALCSAANPERSTSQMCNLVGARVTAAFATLADQMRQRQ